MEITILQLKNDKRENKNEIGTKNVRSDYPTFRHIHKKFFQIRAFICIGSSIVNLKEPSSSGGNPPTY